jgi:16S rRNA processing protein RimM
MIKTTDSGLAPSDLVELGRVISAYGVLGWVKIQPHSAQAEVLYQTKKWWLASAAPDAEQGFSSPVAYTVLKARPQGSSLVAQLGGVSDRDQAEALRGMSVCASRALFPKPDQDEYYWVDLIGCALYGKDAGNEVLIGEVLEVMDNGAHGVLRIALQQAAPATPAQGDAPAPVPILDAKGRQAETLVPFVRAHIHAVDLTRRRIDSDWSLEL